MSALVVVACIVAYIGMAGLVGRMVRPQWNAEDGFLAIPVLGWGLAVGFAVYGGARKAWGLPLPKDRDEVPIRSASVMVWPLFLAAWITGVTIRYAVLRPLLATYRLTSGTLGQEDERCPR